MNKIGLAPPATSTYYIASVPSEERDRVAWPLMFPAKHGLLSVTARYCRSPVIRRGHKMNIPSESGEHRGYYPIASVVTVLGAPEHVYGMATGVSV